MDDKFFLKDSRIYSTLKPRSTDPEIKIEQIGNLMDDKGRNFKNPQCGRVYDPEGLSPTLNTCNGGNRQPKVIVRTDKTICLNSKGGRGGKEGCKPSLQDRVYSVEGIATACTTCYPTKIKQETEIRKLTPKECFRLMGFDDRDIDTLRDNGISDAQLYKMAGNSIVVDVVYHIFEQLRSRYPDILPRGQMSIEDLMREEV